MAQSVIVGNYASTTLAAAMLSGDLTMSVVSTTGFPVTGTGQSMLLTITDGASYEIVEATFAGIGTSFSVVTRGMEGTVPQAWAAGAEVSMRITAGMLAHANAGTLAAIDPAGASPTPVAATMHTERHLFPVFPNGTVVQSTVVPTVTGALAGAQIVTRAHMYIYMGYAAQPTGLITSVTAPTMTIGGAATVFPAPTVLQDAVNGGTLLATNAASLNNTVYSVAHSVAQLDLTSDTGVSIAFDGLSTVTTVGDTPAWTDFVVDIYLEVAALV